MWEVIPGAEETPDLLLARSQPGSIRAGGCFYWMVKPRSLVSSSILCLNRALDSYFLPKYRLGCVRAVISLNGSGKAHLGLPPTTLACRSRSPTLAQTWAHSCPLSRYIGTPVPPICYPWLTDKFFGVDFRPTLQGNFVSCPVTWVNLRPLPQTYL